MVSQRLQRTIGSNFTGVIFVSLSSAVGLPFLNVVDVAFPLMLLLDIQSTHIQKICQIHTPFHDFQIPFIGFPDAFLVVKPHCAFRHRAEDLFIEVRKQPACTDICPGISVSYTHLDVYKRQQRNSSKALSPFWHIVN